MKLVFLVALIVLMASPIYAHSVRADTNVTNCTILNTTGETYLLTADIIDSTVTKCMDITADNVTLDCQNHIIDGVYNSSSQQGIYFNNDIGTLKNCILTDWFDYPLAMQQGPNNIDNCTLNYNKKGISLGYDIGATSIINNTIVNNTINNYAIDFYGTLLLTNSKLINGTIGYGLILEHDTQIIAYNNLFSIDDNGYFDTYDYSVTINQFNTTKQSGTRIYSNGNMIGGNYYTNSTGNGYSDTCADANTDGFCDDALDIEVNGTYGVIGACAAVADGLPACGNNTDWLPLSSLYEREEQEPTPSPKPIPNATFNITDSCCPISQYYCTDNETLVQLWNTSEGVSWAVAECAYGCDNVTSSCAPAPFEANIWTLAIIIGIIIAIAILYRWSRR